MKKIIIISILFSVFLGSCKESFLDQERPLVSTEAIIYTDSTKTEMALLGLYGSLKGSDCDFMGGWTYVVFDALGDDVKNIDPNGVTLYMTYIMQVLATTQENTRAWARAYTAINRVNVFIESMEQYGTADIIGAEKARRFIAEAKFVRAMSYYYLVNLYSSPYKLDKSAKAIPLRLTGIKENGHSDMACVTNAKIYESILSDLADSEALPSSATVKTRATRAAANMLKMRVYMAMENWSAAISAGEAISGYQLVTNVAEQWSTPYYTNESIFSLPMSTNDRPNTQRSGWEYYNTGRLMVIDKENGVMSKANYSLAKDKRAAFDKSGTLTKFPSTDRLNWVPIFRFAETRLNLAECYARSNRDGDARTALSDVRRRSIAEADDPLDISTLSGGALLEAISFERRLEFIGEGIRGLDILRKGEPFDKGDGINISFGSTFYTWPIPEEERVNNALWDQLAN